MLPSTGAAAAEEATGARIGGGIDETAPMLTASGCTEQLTAAGVVSEIVPAAMDSCAVSLLAGAACNAGAGSCPLSGARFRAELVGAGCCCAGVALMGPVGGKAASVTMLLPVGAVIVAEVASRSARAAKTSLPTPETGEATALMGALMTCGAPPTTEFGETLALMGALTTGEAVFVATALTAGEALFAAWGLAAGEALFAAGALPAVEAAPAANKS